MLDHWPEFGIRMKFYLIIHDPCHTVKIYGFPRVKMAYTPCFSIPDG